jgi:hypothetical protein
MSLVECASRPVICGSSISKPRLPLTHSPGRHPHVSCDWAAALV